MDKANTHISENQTAAYIDWLRGEGGKPEQTIIDHVADCDECMQGILELSTALDQIDTHQKKAAKPWARTVLRWAAALAAVLLIALAVEFIRNDQPDANLTDNQPVQDSVPVKDSIKPDVEDSLRKSPPEKPAEEIHIKHDTILYAQNFEPNPELELLAGSQFRSGGTKPVSVPVKNYYVDSLFNPDFIRSFPKDAWFTLIDNEGLDLKQVQIDQWGMGILLDYEPGQFYWKLTDQKGIIQVGKFRLYHFSD